MMKNIDILMLGYTVHVTLLLWFIIIGIVTSIKDSSIAWFPFIVALVPLTGIIILAIIGVVKNGAA